MQHIFKPPEKGVIKKARVVRCSHDHAVGTVLFDKLEERIQNPAHLSHIVIHGPFRTNCIEFVKEVNTVGRLDQVEDLAVLGTGLSHEFGDQAIYLDRVKIQPEIPGQQLAVMVLPVPGGPDSRIFRRWVRP